MESLRDMAEIRGRPLRRKTEIPGLKEVWSDGSIEKDLRGLFDVLEQRRTELSIYPEDEWSDDDAAEMFRLRARRYAVLNTQTGDVWPWDRHMLIMHLHCEEIDILDKRSVEAGIPQLLGVEVPVDKPQPAQKGVAKTG